MKLAIALALVAVPVGAADMESAVKALVAEYAAARESRDMERIETLFTPDADQLVSRGIWRRGRPALKKGMLESSTGNPGSRTIAVETVRLLAEGVAIADARYIIAASSNRP